MKVFDFTMKQEARNATGDWWRAFGFVQGVPFCADGVFNGYTKKEIEKTLKNKIREKAGK